SPGVPIRGCMSGRIVYETVLDEAIRILSVTRCPVVGNSPEITSFLVENESAGLSGSAGVVRIRTTLSGGGRPGRRGRRGRGSVREQNTKSSLVEYGHAERGSLVKLRARTLPGHDEASFLRYRARHLSTPGLNGFGGFVPGVALQAACEHDGHAGQ